ncbi:Vibriobactin utilization protein ViuB [Pseudovibrio axinellae]|uniref:Vibriobactin utilization protein ViuB n=1 Tax=Pseudovibrio axinellae TaxID=989403 RepID=A0A165VTX5_9HYPH|nr:siderophore-interacting protein [Pseudovibrio axinellae]KZL15437.1 Vibriobactin utilization protein ViuB [Pseudovibrio axinellae]SER56423.1 NADPH-dependent ferric siderophore reductase, contains FAD-binding and SIP domains [Pseudovibrio axinellae]
MKKTGSATLSPSHNILQELADICERADVEVHGVPFGLVATTAFGNVLFEVHATTLRFTLTSETENQCLQLIPAVVSALKHCSCVDLDSLAWDGRLNTNRPLLNFRKVVVEEIQMLSETMKRIWFSAEDLAVYATELHLRLLIPKSQTHDVEWPFYDASGSIKNPGTDNPVQMRAYTVRELDVPRKRLAIDFYLHHCQGVGSDFAHNAKSGDTLGISGPGGGGIPTAQKLILAGDETALPAILRILEARRAAPPLHVFLLLGDQADEALIPQEFRGHITCHFRAKEQSASWEQKVLDQAFQMAEAYSWVAGEKTAMRRIRKALREQGRASDTYCIAGYWK